MRTVIVTGATGHVGRYVIDELAHAGFDVVAAARSGAQPRSPFGATPVPVRTLALDVAEDAAVALLADALVPGAAIVHLAGWHPPATAASTAGDRRALIETNVLGTMRVLDAARAHGAVDVVVYASTFEIYGLPGRAGPVTEDSPTQPITDYGATKLAGEDHLFAFAAETGIRGVALRLPAVYGPGERVARALPNFVRRVGAGERPVIQGEGRDRRDQIHARDAARAIACALAAGATGAYNVSDGIPHSILELARTAMQVAGMAGEPERRPAEKPPLDFHMAIDRARRALGFTPAVKLADGMAEQLAWVRSGAPE
jgi:UDP-glucose 4-epimerase